MRFRSIIEAAKGAPPLTLAWLLGAFFCGLRFVALDESPPAFWSDEYRAALHHICLGELGISGYGERWPVFVPGAGGGLYTPPYLYLGALWLKVFGPSIVSCRAFAAAFTLLSTIGTACLAHRVAGPRVAAWSFLAAALSPWAFQFARIAWDPPMAPALLVWAVFFWLGRAKRSQLIAAAALFGLALHCYPPTRIQAPLVFALLGGWALYRRSLTIGQVITFGVVGALVAYPVLAGTLDGSLNGRGSNEAIFNAGYVNKWKGFYSRGFFIAQVALDHMQAHFRPTYLFLTGDKNVRHSTQYFGVFGLLDDLALLAVAGYALKRLFAHATEAKEQVVAVLCSARETRLAAFAVAGFMLGVLPAALCWSGVPHALRSIGAYPFLALATGVVLNAFARSSQRFASVTIAVAMIHAVVFAHVFFVRYPELPGVRNWFEGTVHDVMLDPKFDPSKRGAFIRANPEAYRYYSIAYRGETCASSDALFKQYTAKP